MGVSGAAMGGSGKDGAVRTAGATVGGWSRGGPFAGARPVGTGRLPAAGLGERGALGWSLIRNGLPRRASVAGSLLAGRSPSTGLEIRPVESVPTT